MIQLLNAVFLSVQPKLVLMSLLLQLHALLVMFQKVYLMILQLPFANVLMDIIITHNFHQYVSLVKPSFAQHVLLLSQEHAPHVLLELA